MCIFLSYLLAGGEATMKKLLVVLAMVLLSVAPAFAWHCVDTDQSRPGWNGTGYGTWGDNNELNGTTYGWYDKGVVLPEGCEMTGPYQGSCEDVCLDFTLREFVCTDRPEYPGETVIQWIDKSNSPACGYEEVPEFGAFAAVGVLALAGLFIYNKRR